MLDLKADDDGPNPQWFLEGFAVGTERLENIQGSDHFPFLSWAMCR